MMYLVTLKRTNKKKKSLKEGRMPSLNFSKHFQFFHKGTEKVNRHQKKRAGTLLFQTRTVELEHSFAVHLLGHLF